MEEAAIIEIRHYLIPDPMTFQTKDSLALLDRLLHGFQNVYRRPTNTMDAGIVLVRYKMIAASIEEILPHQLILKNVHDFPRSDNRRLDCV